MSLSKAGVDSTDSCRVVLAGSNSARMRPEDALDDYLKYVNSIKKTGSVQFKCSSSGTIQRLQDPRNLAPSGPRRPGEGVEDEEQGIVGAEKTQEGAVYIYITLLGAGFVIGPKGSSIHQICHITGADIRSWSTYFPVGNKQPTRALRVFQIQGKKESVLEAVKIMVCAIDRYKELSEGQFEGQVVDKEQNVLGIEFHYQPPPKHVVPTAARIKSDNFVDKGIMYNWESGRIPLKEQFNDNLCNFMARREELNRLQALAPGYENMHLPVPTRGYAQLPQGSGVPLSYYNPSNQQYYQYVQYYPNAHYTLNSAGYESGQWPNAVQNSTAQVGAPPSQLSTQTQLYPPTHFPVGAPIPQPNAGQITPQYPLSPNRWGYTYVQNVPPPPPNPNHTLSPNASPTPNPLHFRNTPNGYRYHPQTHYVGDVIKQVTNISPTGVEEDFGQV